MPQILTAEICLILCGYIFQGTLKMNIQSTISREIFIPSDEKLLVAIEVRRRIRRKGLSFLKAGLKKDYLTFLCISGNAYFCENETVDVQLRNPMFV